MTEPETKNRFIVLSIDESREQTQKILAYQRRMQTLEGISEKANKSKIIKKHRNFQSLLKKVRVINPYAEELTYIEDRIQVRREHPKYLNLISTVAFLRQGQKEVKRLNIKEIASAVKQPCNDQYRGVIASRSAAKQSQSYIEYIEVDTQDIKIANEIAHYVLGRSVRELSEPSRRLLDLIYELAKKIVEEEGIHIRDVKLTRRNIREYTKWSDYQVRMHLEQLVELEYVVAVMGKQGQQYYYELRYEGEELEGDKLLIGLKENVGEKKPFIARKEERELSTASDHGRGQALRTLRSFAKENRKVETACEAVC
jgi:uncharacterized protein YaaQ